MPICEAERVAELPLVQRVAAYAVILRDDRILLSRLRRRRDRRDRRDLWTLPGGGVERGENPRAAVLREIHEETGLHAEVGETARIYSEHRPRAWRSGRRVDAHSLRIVYDGWVPVDAPEPRVVEVNGSTEHAAWVPVADVVAGRIATLPIVLEALADHRPHRKQRVAAYALVRRDGNVLLTRVSSRGHHSGAWALPGGGIDHGETPRDTVVREVQEECGVTCEVGALVDVHSAHFRGTAPSGRDEDFHAVSLIFEARVPDASRVRVAEDGGTTDAVAWHPVRDVLSGAVKTLDVVPAALEAHARLAPSGVGGSG